MLRDNLQPTDFANAICKVSPWVSYEAHGVSGYRIWECSCGAYWFQRHEWSVPGQNSTKMDEWIFQGYFPRKTHAAHMVPAPKDI